MSCRNGSRRSTQASVIVNTLTGSMGYGRTGTTPFGYKLEGKDREEKLGWESDWTQAEKARKEKGEATGRTLEQEAILRISEIKSNHASGKGPLTLEKKREAEKDKRETEAAERKASASALKTLEEYWNEPISRLPNARKRSLPGARKKPIFACGSALLWELCRSRTSAFTSGTSLSRPYPRRASHNERDCMLPAPCASFLSTPANGASSMKVHHRGSGSEFPALGTIVGFGLFPTKKKPLSWTAWSCETLMHGELHALPF